MAPAMEVRRDGEFVEVALRWDDWCGDVIALADPEDEDSEVELNYHERGRALEVLREYEYGKAEEYVGG